MKYLYRLLSPRARLIALLVAFAFIGTCVLVILLSRPEGGSTRDRDTPRPARNTSVAAPARALASEGRWREAEDELRRSLAAHDDHPELQALLGQSLLEQGRPEEALPLLERAVDLDPRECAARDWLSRALAARGRAADARIETEVAEHVCGRAWSGSALTPEAAWQARKEAATARQGRDLERAARILGDAVKASPLDPDLARDHARVLLDLGEHPAARDAAARAWRIGHDLPRRARELAVLVLAEGDVAESERLQRRAQEMEIALREEGLPAATGASP